MSSTLLAVPRRPVRPHWSVRALFSVVAIFSGLLTGAIMLSDQAPGFLQPIVGDAARKLWSRIDGTARAPELRRDDLPATDFLAHVVIWAALTFVVVAIGWSVWWLMFSSIALGFGSLVLELAQGTYSSGRAVQASDGVANLIGVASGAALAGLMMSCYWMIARPRSPKRHRAL